MGFTESKQRYVVITDNGVKHPIGTVVEVEATTSYGLYCQAVDGKTSYWYDRDELLTEDEWKGDMK